MDVVVDLNVSEITGAAVGGFGIDNRSGVKQLRRDPTPKLYGVLS